MISFVITNNLVYTYVKSNIVLMISVSLDLSLLK